MVPHQNADKYVAAIQRYVETAVLTASRRISVAELVIRDDETECTQVYSNEDMVHNIVSADTDDFNKENGC